MRLRMSCTSCGTETQHAVHGDDAACTSCGLVHSLELALLDGVFEMAFCAWCRDTRPVGHDCSAGAVGCTLNPPDGPACGRCSGCLGTQVEALSARRAEYEHGSPSELDGGA